MNTGPGIIVASVIAQDGALAAVGDINAMLGLAGVAFVVFQKRIIREIRENASRGVTDEMTVADYDVWAGVDAQTGAWSVGGV